MNLALMTLIGRCDGIVEALRAELGMVLAERVLAAEAADFLWEARVRERYLGEHVDAFEAGAEGADDLSRIAFLSVLERTWHAGICLVDGEGAVAGLLWEQSFGSREDAEFAFGHAR